MGIMSNDIFDLLSFSCHKLLYLFFIFLAVRKELESKLEFWRGKQLEIEGKFKDVHSAPEEIATSGKSKTRKTEKKKKGQTNQVKECSDYANYNLSCYAGSFSKEFLSKVSFFLPSSLLFFSLCKITIRDVLCMHVC